MSEGLSVLSIPLGPGQADEVSDWLVTACGASPVQWSKPRSATVWLECYFDDEPRAQLAGHALETRFGLPWSVRPCPDRDWTEFWKLHFHPTEIGRRLLVCPPWDTDGPCPGDRVRLVINPGMSFGTGKHFTTRFCLEALEEHIRPGDTVCDAGTGSGILSIAAIHLGAQGALGLDIDATALESAEGNLIRNGVESAVTLRTQDLLAEPLAGDFDLVFANIYGHALVELAEDLLRASRRRLVLSGIRAQDGDFVANAFIERGGEEIRRDSDHEWCGIVLAM